MDKIPKKRIIFVFSIEEITKILFTYSNFCGMIKGGKKYCYYGG